MTKKIPNQFCILMHVCSLNINQVTYSELSSYVCWDFLWPLIDIHIDCKHVVYSRCVLVRVSARFVTHSIQTLSMKTIRFYLQCDIMRKTFIAISAFVWAWFSMASHVYVQCIRTTEFPVANFTGEIVNVIMNFGMIFHLRFSFKSNEFKEKYVFH